MKIRLEQAKIRGGSEINKQTFGRKWWRQQRGDIKIRQSRWQTSRNFKRGLWVNSHGRLQSLLTATAVTHICDYYQQVM